MGVGTGAILSVGTGRTVGEGTGVAGRGERDACCPADGCCAGAVGGGAGVGGGAALDVKDPHPASKAAHNAGHSARAKRGGNDRNGRRHAATVRRVKRRVRSFRLIAAMAGGKGRLVTLIHYSALAAMPARAVGACQRRARSKSRSMNRFRRVVFAGGDLVIPVRVSELPDTYSLAGSTLFSDPLARLSCAARSLTRLPTHRAVPAPCLPWPGRCRDPRWPSETARSHTRPGRVARRWPRSPGSRWPGS